MSTRPTAIRTITVLVIAVIAISLSACGDGSGDTPEGSQVRGALIDVDSASLSKLTSIDLRDEAGKDWHFVANGYSGFTPSHLRDHMVQALPVTVTYHEENGNLVIDEITD